MSLKIEKFSGPGSTPSRRRFWDNVADAVASCRKLPGKNISVTEYDSGSLIDVNPQRAKNQGPVTPTGACCIDSGCTIKTEAECLEDGGEYQGDGTTCSPNPCPGVCCHGEGGHECEMVSEAECEADGGTFLGPGDCDSNPCCICGSDEEFTVTLSVRCVGSASLDGCDVNCSNGPWDFYTADVGPVTKNICSADQYLLTDFDHGTAGCDGDPTLNCGAKFHVSRTGVTFTETGAAALCSANITCDGIDESGCIVGYNNTETLILPPIEFEMDGCTPQAGTYTSDTGDVPFSDDFGNCLCHSGQTGISSGTVRLIATVVVT